MSTGPDAIAPELAWFVESPPCPKAEADRSALLVSRSREGCHEAYAELIDRHRDRIFRFCLGWTGNPEDAEELCQDVFVRAYSALPRYQGERHFSAWLFRIARNRCHDHRRSRSQRNLSRNRPLESSHVEEPFAPGPRPDENAADSEELLKLREAIAALPERLREVIVLCGIEGLSQGECATLLGCSCRAVEGRLYRARQELAESCGGSRG
jgi:RNA polymerase sigma-70 factor (ECF subfamily)